MGKSLDVIVIVEQLMTLPKAFKSFKDREKSGDSGLGKKRCFNHLLFTPLGGRDSYLGIVGMAEHTTAGTGR